MGYLDELMQMDRDALVNQVYNRAVGDYSDFGVGEADPREHGHGGKRIPYIGWFWRDTDFVHRRITIGRSASGLVGVMESNKWYYPERLMTAEEAETFITYLDRAFAESGRGGLASETRARANGVFAEMWDWFQTLPIPETTGEGD